MATGLGNKTLTLQGANTGFNTLGGVIEDSTGFKTALVKDGAGVWRLTGTSTFTGATTVKAGTLLVNGALDAGSAVTVEGGGTLGGTGALNGSLAVQSGGVVAPGAGGIGVLTVNLAGAATAGFAADASFAFELGVPGHGDVLAFAGLSAGVAAVTFNGNKVNFTATDPLAEGIHTLCTFDQNAGYVQAPSQGDPVPDALTVRRASYIIRSIEARLAS
jgi:autotransporter-associated beta strand protein